MCLRSFRGLRLLLAARQTDRGVNVDVQRLSLLLDAGDYQQAELEVL